MYMTNLDTLKELSHRQRLKNLYPGKIDEKDLNLIYSFSRNAVKDLGSFIHAIILWGSVARDKKKEESDVDLLALVDDLHQPVTQDIVSTYRLAVGKILAEIGAVDKIHLTTIGVTDFWDGVRHADPIIVTLLRDGKPIVDTGFFKPLQRLLEQGRIRPTPEAIDAHITRAKQLLRAADNHILIAVDDFYWALMDSSHAALMKHGVTPKVPSEVAETLKKNFKGKITKEDVKLLDYSYSLMKKIAHNKVIQVSGVEVDELRKKVTAFVEKMNKLVG